MNSTNLIIIVFGLIILAWFINQKNEGFSFFDKIEQFIETLNEDNNQEEKLPKDWDLGKEMQRVMAQKQLEIKNADKEFSQDNLGGIEPRNLYFPMNRNTNQLVFNSSMTNQEDEYFPANINPYAEDITKLDWKLEKNPHQVIEELKNAPDRMLKPISLKEAFDATIKQYKQLAKNPQDNLDEKKPLTQQKALDQNQFSYLEGKQPSIPKQDEIFAVDAISSNFSYF